jgi:hypothetical protein
MMKKAERAVPPAHVGAAAEQAYTDQLRLRLAPVVDHAIQVAREQAAQATTAATIAREWAAPRLGAAVERGRTAAAPHVEAAAERVAPAVDAARDRIIEDLLPRLVDAVHHAALAGAAAKAAAAESVSRTVEEAARSVADATPSAKARVRRRRRRTRSFWLALAAALVSAVVVAVGRRVRAGRAAWEVPATGVPSGGDSMSTAGDPAASGSVMDVVAAAAGPSDAGVAAPSPLPDELPADHPSVQMVETSETSVEPTAPSGSASSTGADAEPSPETSDTSSEQGGQARGPETVGIETGLDETLSAEPHGHRS